MPQDVPRNLQAEAFVRDLLRTDQMKNYGPDDLPLPPSPLNALRVPMSPTGSASGLTRLLAALLPSQQQVKSVTQILPPGVNEWARSEGLDPRRVAGTNDLNGNLFVDAQRSPQDQYNTLLHEVSHSAWGKNSEPLVRTMEQMTGMARPGLKGPIDRTLRMAPRQGQR